MDQTTKIKLIDLVNQFSNNNNFYAQDKFNNIKEYKDVNVNILEQIKCLVKNLIKSNNIYDENEKKEIRDIILKYEHQIKIFENTINENENKKYDSFVNGECDEKMPLMQAVAYQEYTKENMMPYTSSVRFGGEIIFERSIETQKLQKDLSDIQKIMSDFYAIMNTQNIIINDLEHENKKLTETQVSNNRGICKCIIFVISVVFIVTLIVVIAVIIKN